MGDPQHSAEPDNILTVSDRNIKMWLCNAFTAAASDGALSLVRPTPCCVVLFSCWVFLSYPEQSKEPNLLSLSPRFLLENFYIDEHMRYIVTTYPVVILFLAGTLSNSGSSESFIYTFEGTLSLSLLTERRKSTFLWFDFLCSYVYLISSSLLSCNPCHFLHYICGTHRYDHMEAPQASTIQRQWTQYVSSWNCPQTKQTLSMNLTWQRFSISLVLMPID